MFVNDTAATPTADQCTNGTGITAEYNTTVDFSVPGVTYNVTAVDPSVSNNSSSTNSPTSDATQFKVFSTTLFGMVIFCLCLWIFHY
jgi:hypothetical protein